MAPDALQQGTKLNFVLSVPDKLPQESPLVVLAGWVGCKDRYLAKFSFLLTEAGYSTIRSVCPTAAIFFPTRHPQQRWAEALLNYIDAVDPGRQRSIVLWAFSNGGAFPLSIISRLTKEDDRYKHFQQRIKGVIFDSAPCYMHRSTGARVLGEGQPPVLRAVMAAVFYLVVFAMYFVDPFAPQRFWNEMTQLNMGSKTLYLYSADDHLCDATMLDQLIEARRVAGHSVQAHKWESSRHVAHYRLHSERYAQLVLGFLKELQG